MRITAKLAYNQLKVNRQRTMWAILGIVLSTALITAICSFVASGNAMLIHLYGESYSEQSRVRIVLILIPALILSVIIVSMAVVVISNVFRVSAGERRAQFGILKSVGSTKKQIMASVMYESVFLSLIGIPVGILAGLVIAFGGVLTANHYLGELNSLVQLMVNELTIVIDFVISWQAILAAFVVSFFTVLISAWLPAKKAARVTAIDSIRRVDEVKVLAKHMHTNPLIEKLFGVEGTLAAKNMKRSKRNLRASVISLTAGIVLFICLGSLSSQMNQMTEYMKSYNRSDVTVDYASSYESVKSKKTGKEQFAIIAPIDSKVAEEITEKLRKYKETDIWGSGMDNVTYTAIVPDKMLTSKMKKTVLSTEEIPANDDGYEIDAEIITVDETNYESLCRKAGVPVGSNILINHYVYNDNGNAVTMKPFLLDKQSLKFHKADGTTEEIKIHGELTQDTVPEDLIYPAAEMVRLIVPEGVMRGYSWDVNTNDVKGFMDYANVVMNEFFPEESSSNYMEHGFSTRVFRTLDYIKVMNIGINLVKVFVQSFVILLASIGLTNVISTMSANVQMRAQEFAVLKSIGMTTEGVKRMIGLESIICSVKSLVIGVPLASVLTYLIHIPIRSMLPVPYQFPLVSVITCTIATFVITGGTMWISSARLRQNSIVEAIRM